ncbi:MAG: prolipoprotein diacylglyceryl transferase [Akkermansia sp.]
MSFLATYIHHLDPVMVELPFSIGDFQPAIRWYGFAYIMGFLCGYLVLLWLSKRKLYSVPSEKLGDFISLIAICGVLLGGRLGETIFYWLPRVGWEGLCADPFWFIRVWEGGMASHGGIIAVALTAFIYARRSKLPALDVMDGLAIVATLGIAFGRIANFINGELYGRVCETGSWVAMKFPLELNEFLYNDPNRWIAMSAKVYPLLPPSPDWIKHSGHYTQWLVELCRDNEAVRTTIGEFLTPRYPSQLFEAAAEGGIIFIILITVRLLWKNAPHGLFCMLFCFMYTIGRFSTEYFREPAEDLWLGFTRGQYLSFGIAFLGLVFAIPVIKELLRRKNKKSEEKAK